MCCQITMARYYGRSCIDTRARSSLRCFYGKAAARSTIPNVLLIQARTYTRTQKWTYTGTTYTKTYTGTYPGSTYTGTYPGT